MWKARLSSVIRPYAVAFVAAFIAALYIGFFAHAVYAEWRKPNCAQEDMCRIDYQNGEWRVYENAPGTY